MSLNDLNEDNNPCMLSSRIDLSYVQTFVGFQVESTLVMSD